MKPGIRPVVALSLLAILLGAPPAARADGGSIVALSCSIPDCVPPPPNRDFVAVAVGNYHTLGLKSDGSLAAWGMCDVEQCLIHAPNTGFTRIAAGDSHSLALRQDGSIRAFGSDEYGQLRVPAPNTGFVAISAGLLHSLGLKSNGSIVCWGGGTSECNVPQPNTDWVAVAGGGFLSMGLKSDGSIRKWGCNGPCEVPEPNTGFTAMATSHRHSLALKTDGSIVAWGANDFGQLDVPAPNSGFVAIAAGANNSLALRSDGTIACWGQSQWCAIPAPNADFVAVAWNTNYFAHALRAGGGGGGCQTNADCDDGLFCNGPEACNAGTCAAGPAPCSAPLFCRESDDRCVQCLNNATCDDGLFCNGAETCNAFGSCQAGPAPCTGVGCDETTNACFGGAQVWLSFTAQASVPGVGSVAAQDIVARNLVTNAWSLVFDGSDVGLGGLVIDGMARLPDGSILLSFTASANIPGMTGGPGGTTLDDSDIVRFVPATLGPNTSGSFVFYFDGSDVGLTTDNEDIDAIALTSGGQLLISTVGAVSAAGASGADTDLLRFNATRLGSTTSGSFAVHFDGSDVGLTDNGDEDVDAAGLGPNGTILLSTTGSFSVSGLSGADEDVIRFSPATLGGTTSGTYSMFLDLSALGVSAAADVGSVEYVP